MVKFVYSLINREKSGFSLMEVTITMGLVSLTALTMSQMTVRMQKSQNFTRETTDFNTLVNLVNSTVMGDATCTNALNGNAVNTAEKVDNFVTLNLSGTTVGGGSTYGSLTGIQVRLTRQAGTSGIQSNAKITVPTLGDIKPWFIPMSLVITANRNGQEGLKEIASSSTDSSATKLTISVSALGAKQPILGCTGLRLSNKTDLNLPVCGDGEAAVTNGNQISCVRTVCPAGTYARGVDPATKGVQCASYPLCSKINVSIGSNTSTSVNSVSTSTVSLSLNPMPVYSGSTLIAYKCGLSSCPVGTPPQYDSDGIIVGCNPSQLATTCTPKRATFTPAVPASGSTLIIDQWACEPPKINSQFSVDSNKYYCTEDCSLKTYSITPSTGELFSGRTPFSKCDNSKSYVARYYQGPSFRPEKVTSPWTFTPENGVFSSARFGSFYCAVDGIDPIGRGSSSSTDRNPPCPGGLSPQFYYAHQSCCNETTIWDQDNDCDFDGRSNKPNSCKDDWISSGRITSPTTCTASGLYSTIPGGSITCHPNAKRSCSTTGTHACARCDSASCKCKQDCNFVNDYTIYESGVYDIYCQ